MTNVFEIIKNDVDILDVAAHYGVTVNRHNKALCFAHKEKSASLSFKNNRFKCFGCGVGGSVIDMVSLIQGITPLEAAKTIDAMYSLNLFNDKPLTSRESQKIAEDAKQRESDKMLTHDFIEWEQKACNTVATYLRLMDEWKHNHAPKMPEDEIHPLFVEACHNLDIWDWLYDEVFINGDFETKLEFFKNYGKAVREIEKRFNSPNTSGYVA